MQRYATCLFTCERPRATLHLVAGLLIATAQDAAEALVAALNLRFGEITIRVTNGEIAVLRLGTTLKPQDLARLKLYEEGR